MQRFALVLLSAIFGLNIAVGSVAHAEENKAANPPAQFPPIFYDTDQIPEEYNTINPYRVLASMNSWTQPVLMHDGKPHEPGHLVQIIMDGGNGVQDPPLPNGMPGGDDSIAFGNFNMIRFNDPNVDPPGDWGQKGLFYSQKYFIPFVQPTRAYYLRIWEGKDIAKAPYYQDSVEYNAGDDRGGGMAFLPSPVPVDYDWKFGPSKPRPKAEPDPKK